MSRNIDDYFKKHLGLSPDDAERLHKDYSQQYGQAIEGLVRHHQIDALEYNAKVDDAVPLDDLIKPNAQLRQFLEDIDTSKVRLWLLTNAYVNHGKRVVRLLGVDDLFEGLTYCDYSQIPFVCKPHKEMFMKAMREAGVSDVSRCYFIGKMSIFCKAFTDDFKMTLIRIVSGQRKQAGLLFTLWRMDFLYLIHQRLSIKFAILENCGHCIPSSFELEIDTAVSITYLSAVSVNLLPCRIGAPPLLVNYSLITSRVMSHHTRLIAGQHLLS